jgi:hypothetical protein
VGLFVTFDQTYEEACTEHTKVLKSLVIYWTVKCKQEMKVLTKIVFSTRHKIIMCGDCKRNEHITVWEIKIADDSLFCHSFILQDVFLRSL